MLDAIMGGLSIASSLYEGISGSKAAKAQKKAYEEMARKAKETGELNIAEIQRVGVEEQKALSDVYARRQSTIEGMYSKSGLLLTGSPRKALGEQKKMDQYAMNEHNKQVAFQAKMTKLMAENQAAQYMGQAQAAGKQATTSLLGGLFGAAPGAGKILKFSLFGA